MEESQLTYNSLFYDTSLEVGKSLSKNERDSENLSHEKVCILYWQLNTMRIVQIYADCKFSTLVLLSFTTLHHITLYHLTLFNMLCHAKQSLIYGEVDYNSFYRVLRKINPRPGLVFYDLGSGTSKVCLIIDLIALHPLCLTHAHSLNLLIVNLLLTH